MCSPGKMKNKPNLENAYDLKSQSDNIELYSSWAETYDLDFIDEMQYELHFPLLMRLFQTEVGA